ncbi:PEP-CTERM sorting domain-containing protein [Emcibacter sp.]|uniref:PEP-CTERM sorting domain-containing protein n=1 Tax=Emcibacter sp. TaxID=1979954 RepID=UPI002AA64F3B|nr:PEP-CTERM sorting domain-containing protein [Emcibacter sp.]
MFKKYFALLTLVAGLGPMSALAAPLYNVEVLADFGGVDQAAYGVNDYGQVVGYAEDNNGIFHSVLWENGTFTNLGAASPDISFARDINNSGQVAGFYYDSDAFNYQAYSWKNGNLTNISHPDNWSSRTYSLNNNGDVLVATTDYGGKTVIWKAGEGYTEIDTSPLTSATRVVAQTINDAGQIVGYYEDENWNAHPFFRDSDGTYHEIPIEGDFGAFVQGLNEDGDVVGIVYILDGDSVVETSFEWNLEDGLTILDFGAFEETAAYDINNEGIIVGAALDERSYGVLWENNEIFALDDLISLDDPLFGLITIGDAHAINEYGQIAASGRVLATGQDVTFLLTPEGFIGPVRPVPAPGTLGLLICGAGLLLYRRKRA